MSSTPVLLSFFLAGSDDVFGESACRHATRTQPRALEKNEFGRMSQKRRYASWAELDIKAQTSTDQTVPEFNIHMNYHKAGIAQVCSYSWEIQAMKIST